VVLKSSLTLIGWLVDCSLCSASSVSQIYRSQTVILPRSQKLSFLIAINSQQTILPTPRSRHYPDSVDRVEDQLKMSTTTTTVRFDVSTAELDEGGFLCPTIVVTSNSRLSSSI